MATANLYSGAYFDVINYPSGSTAMVDHSSVEKMRRHSLTPVYAALFSADVLVFYIDSL